MTLKYNVTVIKPKNYIHSMAFWELAESIVFALRQLGHVAELSCNHVRNDFVNIIFGAHLLDQNTVNKLPANTILVNTEPLLNNQIAWNKNIIEYAKRLSVWDYSEQSMAYLQKNGAKDVKHLEIGYTAPLNRIVHSCDKDIDILFYGTINDRRKKVLDELSGHGLRVSAIFGIYGPERDSYIARSRIILNMHSSTPGIFEVVRVSYLLMNNACVVSEINTESFIDENWKAAIYGLPYEAITHGCLQLLQNENAMNLISQAGHNFIKSQNQSELLRKIL